MTILGFCHFKFYYFRFCCIHLTFELINYIRLIINLFYFVRIKTNLFFLNNRTLLKTNKSLKNIYYNEIGVKIRLCTQVT